MVLAACSDFFRTILGDAHANNHGQPIIYLRGTKGWELRALLDFMYSGMQFCN